MNKLYDYYSQVIEFFKFEIGSINRESNSSFPKKENFKLGHLIFASEAPFITISGALSPPIASNDIWIEIDKNTPDVMISIKINIY